MSTTPSSKKIYGADPYGNEFDIMGMLPPRDEGGEYENSAPLDRLELTTELTLWAGVRTTGGILPETDERAEDRTEQAIA